MDIIPAVTAYAGCRKTDLVFHEIFVAGAANQALMAPIEAIVRLGIVIELPEGPAVRIVAKGAFRAESTLMNVIGTMATGARRIRILVGWRQMTFLARRRRVQTDKGEARQVVIEEYPFTPAAYVMAIFARLPFLSLMYVVLLVTVVAAGP